MKIQPMKSNNWSPALNTRIMSRSLTWMVQKYSAGALEEKQKHLIWVSTNTSTNPALLTCFICLEKLRQTLLLCFRWTWHNKCPLHPWIHLLPKWLEHQLFGIGTKPSSTGAVRRWDNRFWTGWRRLLLKHHYKFLSG